MNYLLLAATLFCMIPLVLFLGGAFRVRGWRNTATRAIMIIAGAALIVFALALARALGYPPPDEIRIWTFLLVGSSFWWLYISFLVIQREGRAEDRRRLEQEELSR